MGEVVETPTLLIEIIVSIHVCTRMASSVLWLSTTRTASSCVASMFYLVPSISYGLCRMAYCIVNTVYFIQLTTLTLNAIRQVVIFFRTGSSYETSMAHCVRLMLHGLFCTVYW